MPAKIDIRQVPKSSLTKDQLQQCKIIGNNLIQKLNNFPLQINENAFKKKRPPISSKTEVPFSVIQLPDVEGPITICNTVATFQIGCKLNLKKIALIYRYKIPAKYNPKKPATLRQSNKNDYDGTCSAVNIFTNGNGVIIGAKSELQLLENAQDFCLQLQELGIPCDITNFNIHNIVSTYQFGHPINCKAIAEKYPDRVTYDPERIKCCFIKDASSSKTLLVFESGGCVITGNKRRVDIVNSFRYLLKIVESVNNINDSDMSNLKSIENIKDISQANQNLAVLRHKKLLQSSSGRKKTEKEQQLITESRQIMNNQIKQIVQEEKQLLINANLNLNSLENLQPAIEYGGQVSSYFGDSFITLPNEF